MQINYGFCLNVSIRGLQNNGFGELLTNKETEQYGIKFKNKIAEFFGDFENTDEKEETAASTPIRNLVSMGIYKKEEMAAIIEKMNVNDAM